MEAPFIDAPARQPLELVALHWVRIQIVLRLRGATPDPATIRLHQVRGDLDPGDPLATMPPTHVAHLADGLELRFNALIGPGQLPLGDGRWRLEADGRPLVIAPPSFDASAAVGHFSTGRGELRFVPGHDPADGSVWLDSDIQLFEKAEVERLRVARRPQRRRRWPRFVASVRRRTFLVVYHIVRWTEGRGGRRILFASDSRAELGGNLQVVWERMTERGLDREYPMHTLLKGSITEGRSLRDRLRLPWLLATADVVLVDDYMPILYRIEDPKVRIVQLWHASGAFKTVGFSRIGKPGGPSPYARVHKNYTYAIVSSEHDVPFYAEAFGLPEARVVPTGIPRMDRFFDDAAKVAGRAAALALFPASEGRMTILFAPTFRGETRTATYGAELIDYAALHALAVERDAVVIFKMHPFVREPLAIPEAYADRLLDATTAPIDVNDLLFVVDLLITDYSSIVFEYSTLGRPMLFFAYDLEEYIAERDFYVPFEEFVPGRIVRTFPELLDAIRRDDYEADKVEAFARRHFDHLDGTSTDRVIDQLVIAP